MKYDKELCINSGFYGSGENIENFSEKVVKCRKEHKCSGCEKVIQAGDKAVRETEFMDGSPAEIYICLTCYEEWFEERHVDYVED